MLTAEQNERLTRVGPGTPMGELMRRYWHPIAASVELDADNPTKEVRLLGEDLVLYRDASGTVGLIEPSCAHRKANLSYGIPEENGIRCAYHGWIFNETGQCVDQPSEPEGSKFKEKVRIKAYKAQELGGAIFAYMGPEPAPLLPRVDVLVWPGVRRTQSIMIPCNWLQCHENSLDPLHFQWLHRYWGGWVMNRNKPPELRDAWNARIGSRGAPTTARSASRSRTTASSSAVSSATRPRRTTTGGWGTPSSSPTSSTSPPTSSTACPWTTPTPSTSSSTSSRLNPGRSSRTWFPTKRCPSSTRTARIKADWVLGQDQAAWVMQGPITDRTTERLGVSDVGLIMFRRMLEEQMRIVESGGEPMNVIRNPDENEILIYPVEFFEYPGFEGSMRGPFKDIVVNNTVEAELSGDGAKAPGVGGHRRSTTRPPSAAIAWSATCCKTRPTQRK